MFPRALPAILLACLAGPTALAAEEITGLCPLTSDQKSCSRILACIGQDGLWFHGRAFGRGEGDLIGATSEGVECSGKWTSENAFGLGQAWVTCEDGTTVDALFYYQDSYSGTATGRGQTSKGEKVEIWSGEHVLEYFRNGSPTGAAEMKCGTHVVPIS